MPWMTSSATPSSEPIRKEPAGSSKPPHNLVFSFFQQRIGEQLGRSPIFNNLTQIHKSRIVTGPYLQGVGHILANAHGQGIGFLKDHTHAPLLEQVITQNDGEAVKDIKARDHEIVRHGQG